MKNADLKRRILDISYKKGLSHIGSCLTACDIIDEIFQNKKLDEKFVLSSGHAGLALYCVLEKYDKPKYLVEGVHDFKRLLDAEKIFDHHGVHPDRCDDCGIDCSSGSLGHGLPIAIGMALADRTKNVYCLISDGECAEGSIWEALRIMLENNLINLHIYLNLNGWGAYREIEPVTLTLLISQMAHFYRNKEGWLGRQFVDYRHSDLNDWPAWLQGQNAHYVSMDEKMYKEALACLE